VGKRCEPLDLGALVRVEPVAEVRLDAFQFLAVLL
jgi:hypothetical protein